MALGLHEAPHDPEGAEEVPAGVGRQAWDDGVVGPLVGGNTVGVLLIQYEVVASVLQNKAASFWHYACSRPAVTVTETRTAPDERQSDGHVKA